MRSPDGKGVVKKIMDEAALKAIRAKKKKKRGFKGGRYRFDGKSMKRKLPPKRPDVNGKRAKKAMAIPNPLPEEKPNEPGDVLSYLGIQRKSSNDSQSSQEFVAPMGGSVFDSG